MHVQVRQPVPIHLPAPYPTHQPQSPRYRALGLQYTNGYADPYASPYYTNPPQLQFITPPTSAVSTTGGSFSAPQVTDHNQHHQQYGSSQRHYGSTAGSTYHPASSSSSAYSSYDRDGDRSSIRSRGDDYRDHLDSTPTYSRPYNDRHYQPPSAHPLSAVSNYDSPVSTSQRLYGQQSALTPINTSSSALSHQSRASLQNILNPSPVEPVSAHSYATYAVPPPYPNSYDDMAAQTATTTVYTNGNSNGAAARKRKRVLQQQSFSWTTEEQVDSSGRRREVIVLEDTPSPSNVIGLVDGQANGYADSYYANDQADLREVKTLPRRAARTGRVQAESSNGYLKNGVEEAVVQPAKRRRVGAAGEAVVSRKGKAQEDDPWKERKDPAVPPSCDDKEGHYIITPGDCIGNDRRYKIVRLLGQGTFGKVVEAQDLQSPRRERKVAVKIIRAIQKYRDASKIEVRVLERLKQADPTNIHQCIHAEQVFDFRNHVCIVSELLGMCVYDFLKENEFQPFPRDHIHSFAQQLLDSVAFLHSQGLVHTDLKPENILLVNHASKQICVAEATRRQPAQYRKILLDTKIRLIDFGSATFESEYHSSVVSTRHYRAPEIILGMGWSYPCDAYSIGCILVEFYTGTALFQTHDNVEHLAMMEVVMGAMPTTFKNIGRKNKPEFFKSNGALDWPKARASKASKRDVSKMKPLEQIINPNKDDANKRFCELVKELLAFDPKQRIRVRDALASPFMRMTVPAESEKLMSRWNGHP